MRHGTKPVTPPVSQIGDIRSEKLPHLFEKTVTANWCDPATAQVPSRTEDAKLRASDGAAYDKHSGVNYPGSAYVFRNGVYEANLRAQTPAAQRLRRNLGRGETVGSAMASAKRDRIRAGAPTSAWAGVVVLGAGTGVPAIPGSSNSRVYGIVGAGLLFAFVAFLLIRRARAARTDP